MTAAALGRRFCPARRSVRGQARVRSLFGGERWLQVAVVVGDDVDVLVLQVRREALHDRVLAATLLVFIERTREVILVLAGERRVIRRDADPVAAVAGDAQRRRRWHARAGGRARARQRL